MPLLVLVTGAPAPRTSAIARSLAEQAGLPLLGKDALKEVLSRTVGYGDRETPRELGGAAFALLFDMIERLLRAGGSCVLEASFDVDEAREWLARLPPCTVLQLLVTEPGELVLQRHVADGSGASMHVRVDEAAALVRSALQAIYAP